MTEEFEIQSTESSEGGEVSAEAVERLAKHLANGSQQQTQEAQLRKINANAAHVMVKMLKSPGKGTLARLMAKAIREGNPPALVLGVASLACHEIRPEMPRVEGLLIFKKGTWPEEHHEHLEDWERIIIASLEHCVNDFRKVVNRNSGFLPDLAKLIEYVIQKSCHIDGMKGQKMVDGLVAVINR